MHVEILTLCDAATVDSSGKLNILGAFDGLRAPHVPLTYMGFAIALKMRFERLEEGTKKLALSFIDEDGTPMLPPLSFQFEIRIVPGESTATFPFCVNVAQIVLPRFGEYMLALAIDNRVEGSVPLSVRQFPAPGQVPPPPPQLPPGQ